MLISRPSEATSKERKHEPVERRSCDHAHEYQTANELFEIMSKNRPFDGSVEDSLSASDLVILYKNNEMGTNLMTEMDEMKPRAPNQYVETVVYKDDADSDGSETCEKYSADELRHAILVNNERIDLLSNPSLENTLCHKFGDLEMRTSNLSPQYDKHFFFKDPYIKEQLRNLSMLKTTCNDFDNEILPTSLLDYICCKRLEDNYNFYMDNVIKYVKHTIEQLKRISNGEYLTDKAKEKWREVESVTRKRDINNAKIFATSTSVSIPLHVQREFKGFSTTWDDIIHSEVDIRSLSKILEKKVILEIPKLICGSYRFFSKFDSDNLVVKCAREHQSKDDAEKVEPRLDVVLHLGRSKSGQVLSNISSVMVWQTNPSIKRGDALSTTLLPLPYNEVSEDEVVECSPKIIEIEEVKEETRQALDNVKTLYEVNNHQTTPFNNADLGIFHKGNEYINDCNNNISMETGNDRLALKNIMDMKAEPRDLLKETTFRYQPPDDLMFSIQNMNMSSLPEESCEDEQKLSKKKSTTKARVKSPYESKSYLIEEKKRRKLLEIRERRERKKIAMGENCKITKHKYGKGTIMPRPSSSVTKLSITNKSFYNSIYGHNAKDIDLQINKCKPCKEKRNLFVTTPLEQLDSEQNTDIVSPDFNNEKYVNRSYYLDNAVTEIMCAEASDFNSDVKELFSTSTPAVSSDLTSIHTRKTTATSSGKIERFDETQETNDILKNSRRSSLSIRNDPENDVLSSVTNLWKDDPKKTIPIECRKSIDKIYGLIRTLANGDTLECKLNQSKYTIDTNDGRENSIQCSDSGTSLKHQLVLSDASSFSFVKCPATDNAMPNNGFNKKGDDLTTVVPKVIISTKQQANKHEIEKRKKVNANAVRVPENPLKAISQLLHEFDSVQKTRKTADSKIPKKPAVSFDSRHMPRSASTKNRVRLESYEVPKIETPNDKIKVFIHKEQRVKPAAALAPESFKGHHHMQNEEHTYRPIKKKLADIIDEVKEAKGEAVRGPSKFTSRLNTLAQPKKSYVQAMSEEYQIKYGRSLMSDRLQRLSGATSNNIPSSRARLKRPLNVTTTRASPPPRHQPSTLPTLELEFKHLRPASASPEKTSPTDAVGPYKHSHISDASVTHFSKSKMIAVESYVKNHYGSIVQAGAVGGGIKPLRGASNTTIPLLPHDVELSSLSISSRTGEEATAIGNRLHHIINNIVMTKPTALSALHESPENVSSLGQDDNFDDNDFQSRIYNPSSVDSDYHADIFEDKNVKTAVQNFQDDHHDESVIDEISETNAIKCVDVDAIETATELQELQNAIHRRSSTGAFSNHLRIKKLTITPKQSMQQMFILQSGDADSLLLHSTISQTFKLDISRSISEKDICELQSFIKPQTKWNLTNIPMQINTVGYAFPQYNSTRCESNSSIKSRHHVLKSYSNILKENKPPFSETSRHNIYPEFNVTATCHKAITSLDTKNGCKQKEQVGILHKISTEKIEVINAVETTDKSNQFQNIHIASEPGRIDFTSSLDLLVGLLTEIQKISASHISNTGNNTEDQECMPLEHSLENNNTLDSPVGFIESQELNSTKSKNRFGQLDSNDSIYALYLSNGETDSSLSRCMLNVRAVTCQEKPTCADKEIFAEFPVKEFMSTLTDSPSLFPVTITNSTNVTKSLLGILSKPSKQTIFSVNDFTSIYSDSSDYRSQSIEITQPVKAIREPLPLAVTYFAEKKRKTKIESTTAIPFSTNTMLFKHVSVANDPLLKMKRDILVTVYSMLVLTVFAALSFPDILRVMT